MSYIQEETHAALQKRAPCVASVPQSPACAVCQMWTAKRATGSPPPLPTHTHTPPLFIGKFQIQRGACPLWWGLGWVDQHQNQGAFYFFAVVPQDHSEGGSEPQRRFRAGSELGTLANSPNPFVQWRCVKNNTTYQLFEAGPKREAWSDFLFWSGKLASRSPFRRPSQLTRSTTEPRHGLRQGTGRPSWVLAPGPWPLALEMPAGGPRCYMAWAVSA